MASKYDHVKMAALTAACETVRRLALELAEVKRSDLTESEDKFCDIRLPRLIHGAQEWLDGKSMKVEVGVERARKSVKVK